jgi:hypothetical protein
LTHHPWNKLIHKQQAINKQDLDQRKETEIKPTKRKPPEPNPLDQPHKSLKRPKANQKNRSPHDNNPDERLDSYNSLDESQDNGAVAKSHTNESSRPDSNWARMY